MLWRGTVVSGSWCSVAPTVSGLRPDNWPVRQEPHPIGHSVLTRVWLRRKITDDALAQR